MAYRLDSPRQAWSRIGRRRTRTPNGSHMGGGRTRMAGGSKAKTTTRTGSGSVPITPTRDIDRRDIVEKRPSRRTLRRPQPSMMGPGRQTIHLHGGPARTVRATSLRHGPRQQRRGAHRRRRLAAQASDAATSPNSGSVASQSLVGSTSSTARAASAMRPAPSALPIVPDAVSTDASATTLPDDATIAFDAFPSIHWSYRPNDAAHGAGNGFNGCVHGSAHADAHGSHGTVHGAANGTPNWSANGASRFAPTRRVWPEAGEGEAYGRAAHCRAVAREPGSETIPQARL